MNTTSKLNNGRKHLDADTQHKYGVVSRIWIDGRYQHEQALYDAARAMLEQLKEPLYSYTITGVHAGKFAECTPGDMVRVVDREDGLDLYTRILSISKDDVTGLPNEATVVIANAPQDIAGSVADLADRQRIREAYAQGAVSLFADSFYDNCSPQYPATMRFFIPENAVHINQVLLCVVTAPFRGYTQATQGGGNRTDSTTSGGGSQQTSGAGGGGQQTSGAGGGAQETSASVTLNTSNTFNSNDDGGPGNQNHNHGIVRATRLAITDGTKITGSVTWTPSGAHSHSAHQHSVSIPSHYHSVNIPSHYHSVGIPSHQHQITLPDHTHAITYGIYLGSSSSVLTLIVDGLSAGSYSGGITNANIVPYLSKDGAGRIRRGWHTVQITPNTLTRVECNLNVQLFANSRGGGQF